MGEQLTASQRKVHDVLCLQQVQPVVLTNEQIAELASVNLYTASRAINALERQGMITIYRGALSSDRQISVI